jgi:hypothetical protein
LAVSKCIVKQRKRWADGYQRVAIWPAGLMKRERAAWIVGMGGGPVVEQGSAERERIYAKFSVSQRVHRMGQFTV